MTMFEFEVPDQHKKIGKFTYFPVLESMTFYWDGAGAGGEPVECTDEEWANRVLDEVPDDKMKFDLLAEKRGLRIGLILTLGEGDGAKLSGRLGRSWVWTRGGVADRNGERWKLAD
jgi:hypothetical protein